MKMHHVVMLSAAVTASLFAADPTATFSKLNADQAEKAAAIYNGPRSRVSMYLWSDKYVYNPGQTATFRWTIKTNGDRYPYTVFAYRQNNQTGAKTYLTAAGSTSASVVDVTGNSQDQGFQPQAVSDVSKAVVAAVPIPNELGMHTAVIELRDYTGTRVLKSSVMKIGVVSGEQTISGDITAPRTLTNNTLWRLSGVVNVKSVLTVEPGTFIFGNPGSSPPSLLLVTRDGRIEASGTKSRPIIMTSSQPFGQRKRGDWGGLLMLGKAPINVGANINTASCGPEGCRNEAGTFFIEGLVANANGLYGGNEPNHSCGTLRYVRVEYAGSTLSPNNETNSFTWGGCGKGTVAEHLQASYGLDDSFEWFGGNMDAKWLVGGLGADDYADYQLGYTGRVQFGLFYQNPDSRGNRGIEGDNSEYNAAATPHSDPTFYNMTFIGSGQPGFDEADAPGIFLRRGSRGTFNNMVVSNFYSGAVSVSDANTQTQADAGNVRMNGILIWKNNIGGPATADTLNGQISNAYTQRFGAGQIGTPAAGQQFVIGDPLFARPLEFSDPDWSGLFGSPIFRAGWVAPPDDGFFDQSAKFVGALGDEDWTLEWTNWLLETDIVP
ncbi:MAG: hypothetical protein SGI92_02820 [Bryobacteraceae bacterium]|nr:hypothetical protein [Bryobacteraceae bacterium]